MHLAVKFLLHRKVAILVLLARKASLSISNNLEGNHNGHLESMIICSSERLGFIREKNCFCFYLSCSTKGHRNQIPMH